MLVLHLFDNVMNLFLFLSCALWSEEIWCKLISCLNFISKIFTTNRRIKYILSRSVYDKFVGQKNLGLVILIFEWNLRSINLQTRFYSVVSILFFFIKSHGELHFGWEIWFEGGIWKNNFKWLQMKIIWNSTKLINK